LRTSRTLRFLCSVLSVPLWYGMDAPAGMQTRMTA
jgi:hypothetical protein